MDKNRHILKKAYTIGEEIFNSVSHGLGAVLSSAGCAILVVYSVFFCDAYAITASAIYGATLLIMYLMSTLYHSFTNESVKQLFRIFDHCSIFLLIAGTYTPFTLITLRGPLGWSMFGGIWGAAVLGIVLNAISIEKFKKISLVCYVAMGWVIIFASRPLAQALSFSSILLLIAGGAAYSIGVIFYKLKKLRYMHSLWHLFVLAGSILHYLCVILYVLPAASVSH